MPPRIQNVNQQEEEPQIIYNDVRNNNLEQLNKKFKLNIDMSEFQGNKKQLLKEIIDKLALINGHIFFKIDKKNKKAEMLVYTGYRYNNNNQIREAPINNANFNNFNIIDGNNDNIPQSDIANRSSNRSSNIASRPSNISSNIEYDINNIRSILYDNSERYLPIERLNEIKGDLLIKNFEEFVILYKHFFCKNNIYKYNEDELKEKYRYYKNRIRNVQAREKFWSDLQNVDINLIFNKFELFEEYYERNITESQINRYKYYNAFNLERSYEAYKKLNTFLKRKKYWIDLKKHNELASQRSESNRRLSRNARE